jgi:uncharacterized protein (TIGR02996 family)
MPFTDEQPFLDAVFTRYHDDGPRFIYADFLDDAGDPDRAELVRVQVALARMTDDHPGHDHLVNQEAELLQAHRSRWCEHLSDLVLEEQCVFRRGVLDSFIMDAATFLEKGEELFRRVPFRLLQLRESRDLVSELAEFPLLAKVRELDLCDNSIGNGGLNLLTRSQYLKELESLDLGFNDIDDTGVTILARASNLPRLATLSLSSNGHITSTGMMELAESPFFTDLTTLDVYDNDIDEAGLQAIIRSKSFTRLNTLRLSRNHIRDGGIASLAGSALLSRLLSRSSRLEIHHNEIGPSGIAVLANDPLFCRCSSLDLNNNEIGNTGLESILRSPNLKNLQVLKVSHNHITDAVITAFHDSWPRFFGQLRALDISDNRLTTKGCRILQEANKSGAVNLNLADNSQSTVGAETPIPVADVVQGVLRGVSEVVDAAELRRRVAHPTMRAGDRPNHHG